MYTPNCINSIWRFLLCYIFTNIWYYLFLLIFVCVCVKRAMRPWGFKSSFISLMPWKTSLLIRYWLILGRGFEGSILILTGGALWILPISLENIAHKEGGSWSKRDKWLVSLEFTLAYSETEQTKDAEGSFDSPDWLFWLLLSNPEIIFLF